MEEIKTFPYNKTTFLLTGATGFLGSHLMASLLSLDCKLIIPGRSNQNESIEIRIRKILRWFNLEHRILQLEIVEADYMKPHWGIPIEKYKELCQKTDQIIHCASDHSFSEYNRTQVMAANISCLTGILRFATHSKVSYFHHISTAFVAGKRDCICPEEPVHSSVFTNVYEESKAFAEQIISAHCRKHKIPLTTIRPTIVYGCAESGRSFRFNALYYPIRSLQYIRDIYLHDILYHNGKRSSQAGVLLDKKGILHLPLTIYLPQEGFINLISVEFFTTTVLRIIANAVPWKIYHISSNTPVNMEILAKYSEKLLKVKGIKIFYKRPAFDLERNLVEELFDHFIEPYIPYLFDRRVFLKENTDLATGGLCAPEFTFETFERFMHGVTDAEWSKKMNELSSY
ncbi:MAG: SDR family oxidoreductase [Bacteroidota bacterium]|nr:SDR family oxidoreductase [Bacteroidota bacterium]